MSHFNRKLLNYLSTLVSLILLCTTTSFAASITPPEPCTSQNCVRYVLTTDDGLNIRVFEWKKSDGTLNTGAPPVIFINGFPHAQLEWLPVTTSSLADNFRLITYDMRGQGLSDKPTDGTYYYNGKYSAEIQNIMSTLNLKNTVLVAHSHGGTALMDYIINKGTTNLKGIVLMGAFTKMDLENLTLTAEVFTPLTLGLAPRILSDADEGDWLAANKEFADASSHSRLPKDGVDILAMDMIVPGIVRQAIFLPPRNVINTALTNLAIPSLVIHGGKDALINLSHAVENYNLLGAKSTMIVYPGTGHLPQYEMTNKLIKDLGNFFSRVNSN